MATLVPEMPSDRPESFGADLAGMGNFFIDPAGAAPHVFSRWFWIGPLVVFSIVSIIAGYLMTPIMRHVAEVAPIPPNVRPEQYQKTMEMMLEFQGILIYLAPLIAAILFAIQAAILLGTSVVMGIPAKFRSLFNLVAGCSLIQLLASVAGLIIVKAKSDVSTFAELRPALGLDIFLPEGSNKLLTGLLGYFSVFEIWWIVMIVLIFSLAFKVSRGKAFSAVLPLILLNLILRVAGAAFSR
ncbi:MAG TPA: hypothetical protein VH601_03065 [Bryobacteraceae bacterium]|jgi:hypothetical protein